VNGAARCAFCERTATTEAEIIPTLKHYPKGREEIKRLAVRAPVCAHHAMAINRDRDWQQRERHTREAERQALKELTAAAQLFDPSELDKRRLRGRRAKPDPRRRR
jgi:hypothetical protein